MFPLPQPKNTEDYSTTSLFSRINCAKQCPQGVISRETLIIYEMLIRLNTNAIFHAPVRGFPYPNLKTQKITVPRPCSLESIVQSSAHKELFLAKRLSVMKCLYGLTLTQFFMHLLRVSLTPTQKHRKLRYHLPKPRYPEF